LGEAYVGDSKLGKLCWRNAPRTPVNGTLGIVGDGGGRQPWINERKGRKLTGNRKTFLEAIEGATSKDGSQN